MGAEPAGLYLHTALRMKTWQMCDHVITRAGWVRFISHHGATIWCFITAFHRVPTPPAHHECSAQQCSSEALKEQQRASYTAQETTRGGRFGRSDATGQGDFFTYWQRRNLYSSTETCLICASNCKISYDMIGINGFFIFSSFIWH